MVLLVDGHSGEELDGAGDVVDVVAAAIVAWAEELVLAKGISRGPSYSVIKRSLLTMRRPFFVKLAHLRCLHLFRRLGL